MSDAFNDAIEIVVDEALRNTRTVVPGKVAKVSRADQRSRDVDLDAGIGTRRAGGVSGDGAATDAPVAYPGGGGWSMVWPLVADDEAIALVSDRPIPLWRQNKTVGQAPAFGDRHHDLSDSIVLPVTMSPAAPAPLDVGKDWVLTGPASETMRATHLGGVLFTIPDGETFTAGDVLLADALAKVTALEAAMTALLDAGIGVVPNPQVGTNGILAFTAAKAAWDLAILGQPLGTEKLRGS